MREGDYQGSLLWVLDATVTPMGRRLIRKWVEQPLINQAEICKRHAAVEALATDNQARGDLRMALDGVYDLERLAGRIAAASANARDLNALQLTLSRLPSVISILG
ncbi:MAG TPA: DNA mismatch repair protein MutS, partial [Firmicutes bacterium]|nr:DNA mismatch repair protein MutS [Bacillota bacterium]